MAHAGDEELVRQVCLDQHGIFDGDRIAFDGENLRFVCRAARRPNLDTIMNLQSKSIAADAGDLDGSRLIGIGKGRGVVAAERAEKRCSR